MFLIAIVLFFWQPICKFRVYISEINLGGDIKSFNEDNLIKDRDSYFSDFVNAYKKTVYYFVLRIVKQHDLADEVSQQVFIKVFKGIKQFKGKSSLKTWVLRIAANTALTELNKNKRHSHDELNEATVHYSNDGFSEHLGETSFKQAIDKTLNYLSPVQRMVFTLRHIHGKSTKEASNILDCSEGHIKKQLFLSIQKIRNSLNKLYPDHQWS